MRRLLWLLNGLLVAGIVLAALGLFILDGGRVPKARAAIELIDPGPGGRPDVEPAVNLPVDWYRSIHTVSIGGDLPRLPEVDEFLIDSGETQTNLGREFDLRWVKVHPVAFKSTAHVVSKSDPGTTIAIQPGQKLAGWVLLDVRIEEAEFEEETTGEKVTLTQVKTGPPDPSDDGQTSVGAHPPRRPMADRVPPPREGPTEVATLRVRESTETHRVWDMPGAEVRWWSAYGEEEAGNIAVQVRRDPETGKPDGVEIRRVASGALIGRRGLRPGDVLKSIDGNPVNSREEAVNYLKGLGGGRARYVIVIERRGRLITFTYRLRRR